MSFPKTRRGATHHLKSVIGLARRCASIFRQRLVARPTRCVFAAGNTATSALGYTLWMMRRSRQRLTPLPLPLRWLLALVLILNGAVAPPVMAHASLSDGQSKAVHTMSMHCHDHHGTSSSFESAKHQHHPCPCCTDGGACQCGCIVTLAPPIAFPDLRPLAPMTVSDQARVPRFAAVPDHRLLRPPIV